MKDKQTSRHDISLTPVDTLAGLGSANRELLATCLALFDDSQLQQRLAKLGDEAGAQVEKFGRRFEEWRDSRAGRSILRLSAPEIEEGAKDLGKRQRYWLEGVHSDDQLRLILWIRLRGSLGLPARMTTTFRGCGFLADDMAARLIHVLDPPGLVNSSRRWLHQHGRVEKGQHASNLDDIVLPVLDELLEQAFKNETAPPSREERQQMLMQAIASLSELDAKGHSRLLEETQANSHNDTALRNTLLLGGSLGAFGAGVSTAGFSGYILAAQASAIIPWVSGPGLVSFVSVLSNPITIAGLVGGGGWWFFHSAGEKVKAAMAARVVSMLTLHGRLSVSIGLEGARRCFSQAANLPLVEGIGSGEMRFYRSEWQWLAALPTRSGPLPADDILRAMDQPVAPAPQPDSTLTGEQQPDDERQAAIAMATLTVGDVIYSAAAVDPSVIAAADFIHTADIGSGLGFAELAEQILDGGDRAVLGGISQLKGYVAEQAVAGQLAAAGHTVSLPEAANEPGWDLLVDGQEFQVKFHATLDGLRQHFESYDYPVIANTELEDQIPEEWIDQVFFVDGLSNELVEHVTRESLGAGVDLLDPSVIHIAGVISAAKGVLAYRRGQVTGKQALEQIMLDGMVRMSLAGGGGAIGAGVGLMMFGPAGAWVLGAGAPVLSQMFTPKMARLLREKIKGDAHRQWELQTHAGLAALQMQVLKALSHKQAQIQAKFSAIPDSPAGYYLRWRLEDDHDFALECHQRLLFLDSSARPQPEQRLADTLREMAVCGVHPAIYQPELRAVTEMIKARPGLTGLLEQERLEQVTTQARSFADQLWQSASKKTQQQDWKGKASAMKRRWRKDKKGPGDNV